MINERQPDFTPESASRTRVAGEGGLDRQTAMRIGTISSFMAAAGVVELLSGSVVDAHDIMDVESVDDPTSTPSNTQAPRTNVEIGRSRVSQAVEQDDEPTGTPTPDSTPVPTGTEGPAEIALVASATPTAGETLVAMASGETLASSLNGYPGSTEFQPSFPQWYGPVNFETNPNRLRTMIGTDRQIIVPGYYAQRPLNMPTLLAGNDTPVEAGSSIDGVMVDYDYIVGNVSFVQRLGDPNGASQGEVIYVTFPARYLDVNGQVIQEDSEHKHFTTVAWTLVGTGNTIYTNNEAGQVVPPSTANGGAYNYDQFSLPTNGGVLSFPGGSLQAGTPINLEVIRNVDQIPELPQTLGGHTVEEVIDSLMDSDETNNLGYNFGGMTHPVPYLVHGPIYVQGR